MNGAPADVGHPVSAAARTPGRAVPVRRPVWQPVQPEYVAVRMEDGFVARRVLLSFDEDSQISYAAVPVRNGWLIFQL